MGKITMLHDPERTGKSKEDYRAYDEEPDTEIGKRVKKTYYDMHKQQTVEYVKQQHGKWCKFDTIELTIMEALEILNGLKDESDPDTEEPNSFHAFQTAEGARAAHPDLDWLHLAGLVHDVGKVMALYGQPQWSTVGDTYPVGMAPRESIVFGCKSFQDSPDINDPRYSSRLGIYQENCGLDNVLMSWGHDEYMYQVLVNHPTCTLPKEALWMVRYHSFYPWHHGGDYRDICNSEDMKILNWVQKFQQFDLYTKTDETPDVEALKPYYQSLIDKYIPGKIKF